MTRVQGICIDRTEVPRSQYAAFVSNPAGLDPSKLPTECRGTAAFAADATCDASATPGCGAACGTYPQTCITYCQAAAYCAWAGKTLCGDFQGNQVAVERGKLPPLLWTSVCGNGVRSDGQPRRRYAYGDGFRPGLCADTTASCPSDGGTCRTIPVASKTDCRLVEADVLDMSGNASEWLNAKESPDTANGVHYYAASSVASMDDTGGLCGDFGGAPLTQFSEDLGFRCCAK